MLTRRRFLWAIGTLGVSAAAGCNRSTVAAPVTIDEIGDQVQTLSRGLLPEFAGPGTPGISALYRYAVETDALGYLPCFCGCSRFGHRSNRDCYVKAFNADGTITFTSHAAT